MTRKLLMTVAVIAITLIASIGFGVAEANGGGIQGGTVRGGGVQSGGFHHRGFFAGRGFRGNGLGYGGYYPDTDATAETPPIPVAMPASPVPAVDRPPCRETTPEGVVVERGTACSRGAQ
jgi:hypothetical protein